MKKLWTDGSAEPNPGPGGCAVIEESEGKFLPVMLGSEKNTTNIRMEGAALTLALKYLNGEEGEINTDSEFWINVLTKWAPRWEKSGWKKSRGEIKNLELVKELYYLYVREKDKIKLNWTRGHVGTEGNEIADLFAGEARKGLTIDELVGEEPKGLKEFKEARYEEGDYKDKS